MCKNLTSSQCATSPPLRKGVNINISPSGNVLKVNESVVNALLVCSKVRLKGGEVGGDIARPIAFSLITNAALMLYEVCGCVCVWIKSERVGGRSASIMRGGGEK